MVASVSEGTVATYPTSLRNSGLEFQVSVYLDGLFQEVSLICRADVAANENDANILSSNTDCQTGTSTNIWSVSPATLDYRPLQSALYRQLQVSRNAFPSTNESNTIETVIIRCCNSAPNQVNDPAFATSFAVIRVDMSLPSLPGDIAYGNVSSATILPNPGFVESAPCPCDLTDAVCDPGCCCDPVCPSAQTKPCISGLFGGNMVAQDALNCTSSQLPSFDSSSYILSATRGPNNTKPSPTRRVGLQQLRCVTRNNGAILGYYHLAIPIRTTGDGFNQNEQNRGSSNPIRAMRDRGSRQLQEPIDVIGFGYRQGDVLRLIRTITSVSATEAPLLTDSTEQKALVLPTDANCDLMNGTPVEYLVQTSRFRCPVILDQAMCNAARQAEINMVLGNGPNSKATRLSSRSYLISDEVASRLTQIVYQLRRNRLVSTLRVPTSVNYYCLDATQVAQFVLPTGTTQAVPQLSQLGFFDQTCIYNNLARTTTCTTNPISPTTPSTNTACPWNDGTNLAPSVVLSGNVCENIVLQVDYRFTWTGGQVTAAVADIFLANADVSQSQTYYQSYSVQFNHPNQVTANNNQPISSSGTFGYDPGAQLLTGRGTTTNGVFTVVADQTGTDSPGILKPDFTYLCGTASREALRFKRNSMGSCLVYLGPSEFLDCIQLRSLIATQLNRYLPNELIAVYGSPSLTDEQDWVRIQRRDAVLEPQSLPETTYTRSSGNCPQVPSGIRLDIFYAKQGLARDEPIEQVIGAQLSYTYSRWTLSCGFGNRAVACRQQPNTNLDTSQAFRMTTQVEYTEVPSDWPTQAGPSPNATKQRALTIANERTCEMDACWREVFYAWTMPYFWSISTDTGRVAYEVATGLSIGAIVLILVVVTNPLVKLRH